MSLSGMPVGSNLSPKLSGGKVKGKMQRCAFTAIVRDASFFSLNFRIGSISGSDKVVESSASWSDLSGSPKSRTSDSTASIVGSSFLIYPGRSLVISFVSVKNTMVEKVKTGGFTGSVSVGVSGPRGSIGTISRTVSV
jgi:hypothetical protein